MIRKLLAAAAISAAALAQGAALAADEPAKAAPEVAASATPSPQESAAAAAAAAAAQADAEAPVWVFNRKVAVFRAAFLGVSAADRAKRAERAIREVLDKGGPGKATTAREGQRVGVFIDGELVFVLIAADAERLRAQTLEAVTTETVATLAQSLAETRELRDRARILKAVLGAAIATLAFAAATWLVLKTRNWLVLGLARLLHRARTRVRVAGGHILGRGRLLTLARWLIQAIAILLILVMADRWLTHVLLSFPYTRPWGEQMDEYILGIAISVGGAILRAIPDLLVAIVIFVIARAVLGLIRPVFDQIEAGRRRGHWIDADSARPTRRIVNVAVWLFAIVMAYPYLPGSNSEAFKGMSVLVGLVVTMGGSSLFGQAASGLIIMYSRTLRVGEYVRVGDQEGTVSELGTFTTKIRTGLGEEVTVPNTVVLGTVTKNYSRTVQGHGFVLDTTVTIGYDTPWRQVEAMLIEAAGRTPGVLEDPAPRVFQTGLSDFYPEYRLVCQAVPTEPRPRAVVLSNLHANIQDVFNEYGVQIMSPHYLGDPADAKVVPKSKWYAKPAAPPDGAKLEA
jgi:small-conductance mechanosensitive channel